MKSIEKKREFIINALFVLITVLLGIIAVKYIISPLLPFITAFIITVCSQKAITFIVSKTGLSKKWATVLFTLLLIIVAAAILYGLLYISFGELLSLYELISDGNFEPFSQKVTENIFSLLKKFGLTEHYEETQRFTEFIFSPDKGLLYKAVSHFIPQILSILVVFFKFFPTAIISVAFVLISLFYIGFDYEKIISFFYLQLNEKATENFKEAKNIFTSTVRNIFRAYFLLTFITFVQLFCGLNVMKIKYAFVLSILICLVDLMPILGTGTVLIPWSLFCFVSGNYKIGTGILTMYIIITLFRQFAEPKIVGANIGLSPLLSLISMYLGLRLMGFFGIIIFPVVLITIINLNEKGIISVYRNPPESQTEKILNSKIKFLNFKKNDKK